MINSLRTLIKKMGHSTSVGDEGGFAPMISDNENALKLIVQAIKNLVSKMEKIYLFV